MSSLLIGTAFAQSAPQNPPQGRGGWGGPGRGGRMMARAPGVFGTVSSVSGTTLTVTARSFVRPNATNSGSANTNSAGTVYTVDASNAIVMKGNATSTLSAVAVGDTVMVQGTVSGTSVTATEIRDGLPQRGAGFGRPGFGQGNAATTIKGNGQPVVGGTVGTVSGSTFTMTTAQGDITYNVDASSATVTKDNATSSVSSIASGDKVLVQGSVNGTSVTASTVIDQGNASMQPGTQSGIPQRFRGFLGVIGGFFHRLFGFF